MSLTLALKHRLYEAQCRKELETIDRVVVVVPVDTRGASPRGSVVGYMRDTWPGPFMTNPSTGRQYEERDLWALAEELVNLAIGRLASTGADDWSDYTLPTTPTRAFTRWGPEKWHTYYGLE